MTFEKMQIEDLSSVIEIENQVFKDPWPLKNFIDDLENENTEYYVFKDGEKIIGYAGLWFMFENCDLVNIAIKKEYQGRGLGETFLIKIINEAVKKECEFMHLEVRPSNTKAFKLYEKLGFIKVRTRKGYYEDGEDCFDMVKGLIGLDEKNFSN